MGFSSLLSWLEMGVPEYLEAQQPHRHKKKAIDE